ncbi:MAG TPA: hypothetical protein VK881_12830 [bacterium]|nr:hypothetical protein [bacterium]
MFAAAWVWLAAAIIGVVAIFAVLELLSVAVSDARETRRPVGPIAEAFERAKQKPAA